ncbi:DUF3999 family protein [Roseateles sp. BYS180W]|uniref:DUF3999 family protein n=1 Tax=Roseateles rivi TaxID=3299028 RepID=A0ABW7FST0_9BURK
MNIASCRAWAPALVALASAAALAGPGSTPLQLSGTGPYYRVTLPAALYPLAKDMALSDLRLHSAQGAPLPWAWADATDAPAPAIRRHNAPLFPLTAAPRSGASTDATMQLNVRPDGSLAWRQAQASAPARSDWIIDTHAAKGNLLSLVLTLAPQDQGLYSFSLEASEDLRQWQLVLPQADVVQLTHQGQQLQQNEVDLGGLRARYLRLRWLGDGPAPSLRKADIQAYETLLPSPPPLQWQTLGPARCEAAACTWTLPAHLPLDAVRLSLSDPNTVATVTLLGETEQAPSAAAQPHRHRLFSRHREPTPTAAASSHSVLRQVLLSSTLYRLSLPGQPERLNPDLPVDGNSYQRLRLEARHSIQEWGSSPPQLSVGSRGREIIVLARNPDQAMLSWGQPQAQGSALPLTELMPLGTAQATGQGSLTLPSTTPPAPAAAPSAAAPPSATSNHTPWLWAALIGGLLLLGAMAASLLKKVQPQS